MYRTILTFTGKCESKMPSPSRQIVSDHNKAKVNKVSCLIACHTKSIRAPFRGSSAGAAPLRPSSTAELLRPLPATELVQPLPQREPFGEREREREGRAARDSALILRGREMDKQETIFTQRVAVFEPACCNLSDHGFA